MPKGTPEKNISVFFLYANIVQLSLNKTFAWTLFCFAEQWNYAIFHNVSTILCINREVGSIDGWIMCGVLVCLLFCDLVCLQVCHFHNFVLILIVIQLVYKCSNILWCALLSFSSVPFFSFLVCPSVFLCFAL